MSQFPHRARLNKRATLCVIGLLAASSICLAQSPSDNPLLHKDAWEISVRFTEAYLLPHTALLSTAAIRYGLVLSNPFGKGWGRGSFEYTVDWLPAVVLTKPKIIYCGGVAPVGVRWNVVAKPRLRP